MTIDSSQKTIMGVLKMAIDILGQLPFESGFLVGQGMLVL